MIKFVALYDLHVGSDYKWKKGKWERADSHDLKCIKLAKEFIYDYQPDVIIFGGDQVNLYCMSRWTENEILGKDSGALKSEYALFKKLILDDAYISDRKVTKVWLTGNHETRINRFLRKYPQLAGMLESENMIRDLPYWKIIDPGQIFKLGKLYFIHGDVLGSCPASTAVKRAVARYLKNIRFGHFHSYSAETLHTASDEKDTKTAISVPCLCSRSPEFMKNSPNNWLNGFLYGIVYNDGSFSDSVCIIPPNYKFSANGKLYKGN